MSKYKVKLIHRGSSRKEAPFFLNQSSNKVVGNCEFISNPFSNDYDWLVVIDNISKILPNQTENLSSPKENTILVTTEPVTITKYGKGFTNQFQYLITNQDEKALPHHNAIRSQTGNVWFYGKTYDEIIAVKEPTKTKRLSTVCSDKQQGHTMHKLRYDFTKIMEDRIPELKRFGKGFKWIETKAEAIDDYEFHVAIENHYAPHVWTEKLADTFLGFAVPIYYGCPNIYDYFPEDSIILIDIYDIEGSIAKIKKIIATPGEYERRLPAIKEARRRVLEEYNLLSMINKIVTENSSEKESEISSNNKIYGRRQMRVRNINDLFSFIIWKIKNSLKNF